MQEQLTERFGIAEAVRYSGCSDSTLRRAIRAGVLPAIKVGLGDPQHRRIKIRRVDLESWLERQRYEPPTRKIVDEIVDEVQEHN